MANGDAWTLRTRADIVGEVTVDGGDFPWLKGVARQAGFAEVAPLFAEELRLLDELDEHVEEWEAVYRRIESVVRLCRPDGTPVAEFLLHIDGDRAWFRWSDETFDP